MQTDVSKKVLDPEVFFTFSVHSEFIGTHWHNGTSLVYHTAFNVVRLGLLGLEFLFFEPPCLFYTPFLMKVVVMVVVVVVVAVVEVALVVVADALVVMVALVGMVMAIINGQLLIEELIYLNACFG